MTPSNRVDPRLVVHLPAEYRLEGAADWRPGTLHDLSASGAALLTEAPIPLQTLLTLRFTLTATARDGALELLVEAMGVRKTHRPDLDPGRPCLQGLYFLGLHGERYERLRRFLWDLAGGAI